MRTNTIYLVNGSVGQHIFVRAMRHRVTLRSNSKAGQSLATSARLIEEHPSIMKQRVTFGTTDNGNSGDTPYIRTR